MDLSLVLAASTEALTVVNSPLVFNVGESFFFRILSLGSLLILLFRVAVFTERTGARNCLCDSGRRLFRTIRRLITSLRSFSAALQAPPTDADSEHSLWESCLQLPRRRRFRMDASGSTLPS